MMRLTYTGPKPLPHILPTPIPFVSRSEQTGTLAFNPSADVQDDWAAFLLSHCGGVFVEVMPDGPSPSPVAPHAPPRSDSSRYLGKRFTGKAGKWNAYAFLKRHHLGDTLGMTKLKIGDMVMHWELVPVAQAEVTLNDFPVKSGQSRSVPPRAEEPNAPVPASAERAEESI